MKRKTTAAPKIRLAREAGRKGPFAAVEVAIEAFRRGEMVIVVDDEDRENEGDLTIAAEKVTPEAINFMMTHGRGLICMPMTGERLDELEIPLQVPAQQNTTQFETAFCVGIEAKRGTTTGISAADRAATVLVAIDARTKAGGPGAARARVPAARARRRRAGARRADRGGRRPGPHRGAVPGGRHLRNHQPGRQHGARAGTGEVRAAAPAADDHGRRSRSATGCRPRVWSARPLKPDLPTEHGRVPHPRLREPHRRGDARRARLRRHRLTATTCWCACTPSASPATCSTRRGATAVRSSTRPCSGLPPRAAACCCT